MKKEEIIRILPLRIRQMVDTYMEDFEKLQEIRLRCNQPIFFQYDNQEYYITEQSMAEERKLGNQIPVFCMEEDIRQTVDFISKYSVYAFQEQIKQGFLTIQGGHRVGLCGDVVMENGQVSTMRNISFLNIRIAHERKHCSDALTKYLYCGENSIYNTLLISPPMYGKTTLLRDLIRNFSNGYSDEHSSHRGLKVGDVDERSEIAASYFGIPQNEIGIRTDVIDHITKDCGIMMLIRTMSPQIIALDEIGGEHDISSIEYGMNCGCKFIATIHGDSIPDLLHKKSLKNMISEHLFQRFLIIKKEGSDRKVQIYDESLHELGLTSC